MRKIAVPLLSFVVICLLGATLAISVNGAELSVGSGAQYKSITDAVSAAQPGDTITVSPGSYSENVVITKAVTIKGSSPGQITVAAANPGNDVFSVQTANVHIEGLTMTGATGAAAIHVKASECTVTGVNAHDNDKGVYLDGATNCEVNSCILDSNGYGVYCDHASSNRILSNTAGGERGGSKALGDGIYMFFSNGNLVNHNNLSVNHVFGISLWSSEGNTISNNSITKNEDIGTRLGSSNNNTLVYNIYSGNVNAAIMPVSATGNKIYLNNFINEKVPVGAPEQQGLNSPQQLSYTFNDATHTSYMGNYYSDYKGGDSNGTGIGAPAAGNGDKYPLVQPVEKYTDIGLPAAPTASPSASLVPLTNASATENVGNSAAQASTPGFDVEVTFLAIGVVAFILATTRIRRR